MTSQKHTGRHQLIARLASQVGDNKLALAILRKRGQVDAEGQLTAKGRARDRMTAGERAIDRASKSSGKKKSAYKYEKSTNRAVLKNGKRNRKSPAPSRRR